MKQRVGEKIKLTSFNDLMGISEGESSVEIEISRIVAFQNHPFKVKDDEKMEELIESIRMQGILTPVLVRPDDEDGYEMISGHRRMHAAKRLGFSTIPAIVKEMTDDESTIAMVNANIQREELLPSEKAFAYKMKLDKANQTKVDYMLYGTTLLGIAVFGDSALIYQIGDGDIQIVTNDGVSSLVEADKFLGVETYSLAHDMSWNYAKTAIVSLKDIKKPFLIMMSTDGLSKKFRFRMPNWLQITILGKKWTDML